MNNLFDVIVVGAGLAGSSAAIHLVSRGYSVLLLEKHFYPVHKLCGEFLSGESQTYLHRLGVLEAVRDAGAQQINHALIGTRKGRRYTLRLRRHGLGISRFSLDHILMVRAVAAGVTVRQGLTVKEIEGDLDTGFTVATDTGVFASRIVIGAYGKRSTLDRKLERGFLDSSRAHVAFKAHFEGAADADVVELHAFDGGYLGLCPLGRNVVNACWIGHETMLRDSAGDPDEMLRRIQADNPYLGERMRTLERIPSSYLATSQLYFRSKGAMKADVAMVGDAAGLIAPMSGDGMSMALRSSEILVPYVDRYLRGRVDAEDFRRRYARRWQFEFMLRMQVGYWLHEGFCTPRAAETGVAIARGVPLLGRALMRATRG
ncbi:MAG TPA: NAD(P)/FAD-dependent oxidoreductase [Rhodothermales bacterium]